MVADGSYEFIAFIYRNKRRHLPEKKTVIFEFVKFNAVLVPCNRLTMQYLTQIVQTVGPGSLTV